ncbi:MAG: hypothetical protein ABIG95_01940 [Candidatus Woesearchaeota archaeon]
MRTRDIEKDLVLNLAEFSKGADEEFFKKRYNSAVSLYFKAISVLCDLKCYRKQRMLPKNHADRFAFLDRYFPDVYLIVSSAFKVYTDSYNLRMERDDVKRLRENVEEIKRLFGD